MWGENICARRIPYRGFLNLLNMTNQSENERIDILSNEQWEQLEKEHPYVDLLTDIGFKHVFGNPANKKLLIDFLNAVIEDRHIIDLTYGNNERIPLMKDSKHSRLDLYCITNDGTRIIVELQRYPQKDYIYRSLYYSSLLINEQVTIGSETYFFYPVYSVNILDFLLPEFKESPQVKTSVTLMETSRKVKFGRLLTLIYIELPKFNKMLDELDKGNFLENIYFCLRNLYELKNCPESLESVKHLFEAARIAAMDSQAKIKYIHMIDRERDLRNQFQFATDKGIAEGIEIGRAEGRAEGVSNVARKLKAMGVDYKVIVESTGLSIEEIEAL